MLAEQTRSPEDDQPARATVRVSAVCSCGVYAVLTLAAAANQGSQAAVLRTPGLEVESAVLADPCDRIVVRASLALRLLRSCPNPAWSRVK